MSSEEKKWYVAVFADTNSASVIPDSWLRDGGKRAVWPPWNDSDPKIKKAISSRQAPDVSWKIFVLSKVFWNAASNNYEEARQKAEIAEFTSDVEGEFRNHQDKTLRKLRHKKTLSSSDSEASEIKRSKIDCLPKLSNMPSKILFDDSAAIDLSRCSRSMTKERTDHINKEDEENSHKADKKKDVSVEKEIQAWLTAVQEDGKSEADTSSGIKAGTQKRKVKVLFTSNEVDNCALKQQLKSGSKNSINSLSDSAKVDFSKSRYMSPEPLSYTSKQVELDLGTAHCNNEVSVENEIDAWMLQDGELEPFDEVDAATSIGKASSNEKCGTNITMQPPLSKSNNTVDNHGLRKQSCNRNSIDLLNKAEATTSNGIKADPKRLPKIKVLSNEKCNTRIVVKTNKKPSSQFTTTTTTTTATTNKEIDEDELRQQIESGSQNSIDSLSIQKKELVNPPKMLTLDEIGEMTDSDKIMYLVLLCHQILKNSCKQNILHQTSVNSTADHNTMDNILQMKSIFPIKTDEQFQLLNCSLKQKKNFKKKVELYINTFGGSNGHRITRRILNETISNELGVLYSCHGQKSKKSFKDAPYFELVKGAAIRGDSSYKQEEFLQTVGNWLKERTSRLNSTKKTRQAQGDNGENESETDEANESAEN